jgi:hypothetical protein
MINESYLDRLINDLHQEENKLFTSQTQIGKIQMPKVEKLNDRKVKLISQLKYNANNLKRVLTELETEIKNPTKVKAVGI